MADLGPLACRIATPLELQWRRVGLECDVPAGRLSQVCRDLALAKDRRYSARLVEALQRRVLAAHQAVYGAAPAGRNAILDFVGGGFPPWFGTSGASFLPLRCSSSSPLVAGLAPASLSIRTAFTTCLPRTGLAITRTCTDAPTWAAPVRQAMNGKCGMYIAHNVRIDFQCFAGGIAFGVGSIFYLVHNGLAIGAVAGHLTLGYAKPSGLRRRSQRL